MTPLLDKAGAHLRFCCSQQRYRTAWLIGPPLSGKSTLARELCRRNGWDYLNHTLQEGYFDQLQGRLEVYQPGDLVADLRHWCAGGGSPILLVDEIDATLACWAPHQRRLFANQVSRLPDLPRGLIIVSNFFDTDSLTPLLPANDIPPFFFISGVQR